MLRQAPPRGPRGGGRGGIQKKRTGNAPPARVDKDGDLVMDPTTAGDKRRSGKGAIGGASASLSSRSTNTRPGRGGSATRQQQAILRGLGGAQKGSQANLRESHVSSTLGSLSVRGLKLSKAARNSDGGLESLLGFLERKAKAHDPDPNRVIKIKKSSMKGDAVIITASQEDIIQIQKVDNYMFAGAALSISPCDQRGAMTEEKKGDVSPQTIELKEQFREILASRYDMNLKLLNLSALGSDAGLQKTGVFDGLTNTSKVFPALMAICDGLFKNRKEKRDAIVSVTLTDNNLTNVMEVNALAQTFPDIKNIDLSRNSLTTQESIEGWRRRFRGLENILLSDNPVEAQLPTLKDEILQWYPNLRSINGVQLRTDEEVARVSNMATNPIPVFGPDFRDVDQVAENFIRQFLHLYDNDRQTLLNTFFDSESQFTMSVNMKAPHANQVIPGWGDYTSHSRNMVKITNTSTRMKRRYQGPQSIQEVWSSLPKTRHPDIGIQGHKYTIDCHPLPGLPDPTGQSPRGVDGLVITMHGNFEEISTAAVTPVRSFSRTFTLGPGGPTGIRVINDMLCCRAYGELPIPQGPAPVASQPVVDTEQQAREHVAMQLMEKTGMTLQYAGMCLDQAAWNLEQALIVFHANKDKLPAEAYINGVAT